MQTKENFLSIVILHKYYSLNPPPEYITSTTHIMHNKKFRLSIQETILCMLLIVDEIEIPNGF